MVQPVEGLLGATFEFPIEKGKVLEFAESLGCSDWSFTHIPPTFLTSAFFWEQRRDDADVKEAVELDPSRAVHAEQIFVFHGPPPQLNERLLCQSRVDRIYEKTNRKGDTLIFVDIVTDYHDSMGELRASSTLRAIELPKDAQ